MLELLSSVRSFAAHFAYDLPGQHFVERVGAAREVGVQMLMQSILRICMCKCLGCK